MEPDARYRELLAEQVGMREANEPTIDGAAVEAILQRRRAEFDGHLLLLAANDFGRPLAFFPDGSADRATVFNAVLDDLHRRKWTAENLDLRAVRDEVVADAAGVHKALAALYFDDGTADYDVATGSDPAYNFVTIRQVAGLVDWMANADRWLDDEQVVQY